MADGVPCTAESCPCGASCDRPPHDSWAQYDAVRHLPRDQKQVGDLAFTRRVGRISHVGIDAGGSELWSRVQTGDRVRTQSSRGRDHLVG